MGTLIAAGNDLTPARLNQYYGKADTSATTVTAATQTRLTSSYSVPANEPTAGESAYEILFGGDITWGSTIQSLQFTLTLQAVNVCANVTIASGAFSVSAHLRFTGRASLVFDSTGVSGLAQGGYLVSISEIANPVTPGAAGTNTLGVSDYSTAGATIDTTSDMPMIMKCAWNATTGGPTISNRSTVFRKVA